MNQKSFYFSVHLSVKSLCGVVFFYLSNCIHFLVSHMLPRLMTHEHTEINMAHPDS